uniref:DUF536 domain-containing protein n=1 Tax=uncultured prokaryote TaxID=198431 RepID=A0A0H5Q2W8_9ZZZZ|nr:hypothetical protein [uncultured prokaryote]
MNYSIKEIADKVGVSKTAVNKKITNLGLQTKLAKNGNRFELDEETANIVIQSFNNKNENNETKTEFANLNENSLQEVVAILREQLVVKDKQIADLQADKEQLRADKEELQYSLQQAQALHAGTIQKQLEGVLSEEQQITSIEEKSHWWQFWKK